MVNCLERPTWQGFTRKVEDHIRDFFDENLPEDENGDPSSHWRYSSVGKIGVLISMLQLPEKSDALKFLQEECYIEMEKGIKRKHGEQFAGYKKLVSPANQCPFARSPSREGRDCRGAEELD